MAASALHRPSSVLHTRWRAFHAVIWLPSSIGSHFPRAKECKASSLSPIVSSISQVHQLKFWKVVCVNQPPNCFWVHPKRPNAICFHRMCFQNSFSKQIRTADALNRWCSQRIQLLQAVLTCYVRLKMVVMPDYPRSSPTAKF